MAELKIDLSRLRAAFVEPPNEGGDDAAWLATSVFELSARRGLPGAVTELRRYLSSARYLEQGLLHLLPFVDHPEAAGLLDDVLEVACPEELRQTAYWIMDFTVGPWPEWRRQSQAIEAAVAHVLAERAATHHLDQAGKENGCRHQADRDLLVRAGSDAAPGTPGARLAQLADGHDEVLLEIGPALLRDQGLKRGVLAAVRRTLWGMRSPEALAWARTAASVDDESGLAVLDMLADLADASDLPLLRQLLDAAVATGNDLMYAQCSLIDGIGRLQDVNSLRVVESLFETTVYSYLRRRCTRALTLISRHFRTRTAFECLYDCESETWAIAIRTVDTRLPAVRRRLAQIAEHPTEDDSCRRAVTKRQDAMPQVP